MNLPGWTSAKLAVSGWRAALIRLAFILLFGAVVVQTVRLEGFKLWPISIAGWIETAEQFERAAQLREGERDAERAAHQATKDNYRAAQAEAARLEAARLDRVRAQQEDISDAIELDYRARLADLGARAERLRQELRTRGEPAGAGRGVEGAALRDAAGGSGEAAGDYRLPAVGAGSARRSGAGLFGRSPEEQLERDVVATRQALQLDALISWVLEQSAIDPNADPGVGLQGR